MVLEKKSVTLIVMAMGLLFMVFGLLNFGVDLGVWVVPMFAIVGGLVLLMEVGIKKISNISTLKELGAVQYVSLIIGLLSILSGLLALPVIGIQIEFLTQIAGFVLILVCIFIIIEWFTKD